MATQRITLPSHGASDSSGVRRLARPLRLALWLVVLAIPASGCSSLSETWDSTKESVGKVFSKDDTFVEELSTILQRHATAPRSGHAAAEAHA